MLKSILFFTSIASIISQPPKSTNTLCPTSSTAAAAASKVVFTVSGTTMNIKSTGCPGYDWSSQTTPNTAQYQCSTVEVYYPPKLVYLYFTH